MMHTNGRGFPSDKRLTRPVVERPDSVTHWTCPAAPDEGMTHLMEFNLFSGVTRCRYCKRGVAALRSEQSVILAEGKKITAANARESEFFKTHPREDAKPDWDDLTPEEQMETNPERFANEQVITDEMVARFKTAWHAADARGETGNRVRAGLAAVLAAVVSETEPDRTELIEAVRESQKANAAAIEAAEGDSNDDEIQLLQDALEAALAALDQALEALYITVPEATNEERSRTNAGHHN